MPAALTPIIEDYHVTQPAMVASFSDTDIGIISYNQGYTFYSLI